MNRETLWGKFCIWLAWKLPKRLVGHCYVRVVAHATSGQWSNCNLSLLCALDALGRWYKKHNLGETK